MPIALATPYADTRAADLRWEWGREPLDALAVRDVMCGFGAVELRLLGASHQVRGELAGVAVSELVACVAGPQARALPAVEELRVGPLRYRFAAQVHVLPPSEHSARSGALADLRDDGTLVGVFPGATPAVTAIRCTTDAHTVAWQTWHTYPQTCEIVVTSTTVDRP